ncbi:MAG: hypothetical protein O3C57_01205 [Verrucomicrobia bacterium]|nr:hypothetical protein [Verrucomicrobiota bacterium]
MTSKTQMMLSTSCRRKLFSHPLLTILTACFIGTTPLSGSRLRPARHDESQKSAALFNIEQQVDTSKAVVVDLPAGGAMIHHCQTMHYTQHDRPTTPCLCNSFYARRHAIRRKAFARGFRASDVADAHLTSRPFLFTETEFRVAENN